MNQSSAPHDPLQGLRVLVVEDEAAISMLLEDMLLDFGCTVVGAPARLGEALDLARTGSFDLAILDVNLAGDPIYPVAAVIAERGLPFLFSTGYGSGGLEDPFRERPVVQKPYTLGDLRRMLTQTVTGQGLSGAHRPSDRL